jgi:Tfp pilus assembly protein PilW
MCECLANMLASLIVLKALIWLFLELKHSLRTFKSAKAAKERERI